MLTTARKRGISAVCRHGLEAAAARFGTVVPASALTALELSGRQEPSVRARNAGSDGSTCCARIFRRLPRWRDRLQLIAEHAFPPASFMLARYDARRRVFLPVLYAHRIVTGAAKWLRV